jgi:hypothetical protein
MRDPHELPPLATLTQEIESWQPAPAAAVS